MAKDVSAKDLANFRRSPKLSCFGLASIVHCELEILCNEGGRSTSLLVTYADFGVRDRTPNSRTKVRKLTTTAFSGTYLSFVA
jgi:hypothetical protein